MALLRRQKLIIILLLFYWPAIFILAHIPVPQFVYQAQLSDKTIHYFAYLVLVFLLWSSINPDKKANWRRAGVWWTLLVVVWYGAFDEWLQSYVGRNTDVMDFAANVGGTLTGLILLSIFPFWPVCLVITGSVIFVLTNFIQANPLNLPPVTTAALYLFSYASFSLLWIRYMYDILPIRAPQPKWLIGALAMPTGFLLSVTLFSAVTGNGFELRALVISAAGIAAVVVTILVIALLRRRRTQKLSPGDAQGLLNGR